MRRWAGLRRPRLETHELEWVNVPCTDPVGRLFRWEGEFHRAIYPERRRHVQRILKRGVLQRLVERGLFVETTESPIAVAGFPMVIRTARLPFDVPCDRFPLSCLRDSALNYIDSMIAIAGMGYSLRDPQFGNFMLTGPSRPIAIDIGSIHEGEPTGADIAGLIERMIVPILVSSRHPEYRRLIRQMIGDVPRNGPSFPAHDGPALDRAILSKLAGEPAAALEGVRDLGELRDVTASIEIESHAPNEVWDDPSEWIGALGSAGVEKGGDRRVICLGARNFALFERLEPSGSDCLVVDHDEPGLEHLRSTLKGSAHRILQLDHPINRGFLARAPRCGLLLALGAFERYDHPAALADENIAMSLASFSAKTTFVDVPSGRERERDRYLAALGAGFRTVEPIEIPAQGTLISCSRPRSS